MLVEQVICLLIFWLTKPHDQPFATTVPPRKYTTDSVSEPLRRACRAPIERSCRRCRTDGVDDRRQLGRGVGEAGRRQAAVSHLGVQKHAIDGHLKFGRRGLHRGVGWGGTSGGGTQVAWPGERVRGPWQRWRAGHATGGGRMAPPPGTATMHARHREIARTFFRTPNWGCIQR